MIGSLLVAGFIFISLLVALTYYLDSVKLKFLSMGILIFWSSLSFFLLHNYEGWPTNAKIPRSEVLAIEVVQPVGEKEGSIFVWVYHVDQLNRYFYEYNPENTPRVYSIPYTEKKGKALQNAKELLEKGYILYIGGDIKEGEIDDGSGEGNGKDGKGLKSGSTSDSNVSIEYDVDMPAIDALNPRALLKK